MKQGGIQRALNALIDERRRDRSAEEVSAAESLATDDTAVQAVEIGGIRVLQGLNILAESLIKGIIEQNVFSRCDVQVEQRIDPDMQPDLYAAGLANVAFCARLTVLEDLPRFHETVGFQVRYLLHAIQAEALFIELSPTDGRPPRGVLFPFHREDGSDETGFFYLVEHVPSGHFLRLTLESKHDARLRMTRIPHRVVDRIDLVHARVDIPRAAAAIAQGIIESCMRQGSKYSVNAVSLPDLIRFLRQGNLSTLEVLMVSWPAAFSRGLLTAPGGWLRTFLVRVLIALGDARHTIALCKGTTLRLQDGTRCVYLDLSQRDRCLHIAFDAPRVSMGLPDYLARMPAVAKTAAAQSEGLRDLRVLLIHHLTGEVLGLIQALADGGARAIETLWVKYAGVVEAEYREAILSLPETLFRFRSLVPVIEPDGLQSRFLLADEFSPSDDLASLAGILAETPHLFLEAMRRTAAHLFFKTALTCAAEKTQFIIIEDGGYIAPLVQRLMLEKQSVRDVAAQVGFPEAALPPDVRARPFDQWVRPLLIGSIEHTRNGYDALVDVEQDFNTLAFPSATIAISDFKVNGESRDVAYSCLNAAENIMNALGFVMAERTALVLGAQGAIGRQAMTILAARLGADRLYGVDRVAPPSEPDWTWAENLADLPDSALQTVDLIFGVIGRSICDAEWIERLLQATCRRHLFFASGSTKTAEFSALSAWLAAQARAAGPTLAGRPMQLRIREIHDLKTGVFLGQSAELCFDGKTVTLHLMAGLMPVNFLYYGVPSETMNRVIDELLRCSFDLVRRYREGNPLPPAIWALDRNLRIPEFRHVAK